MSLAATEYILDLVDVNGTPLTQAGWVDHEGGAFTFQDGVPDVFTGMARLDSEAAEVIDASDIPNDRDVYLKAYEQPLGTTSPSSRVLRFYGPVWLDQIQGAANRMQVNAYSADVMLQKRFTLAQFSVTDTGALMKSMVDTTNSTDGETGIRTNTSNITATTTIDLDARTNRPTIQSLRAQFAQMLDGCETWFLPIELAAGKICDMYCGPRRGSTSTALFGFGEGTENNCIDMGRTRDTMKIVNDANGYADALTSQKTDAGSIAAIRRLVEYLSLTGETVQAVLDARTQGVIDAKSTRAKVAEYTLAVGVDAPMLFHDFGIGDTVGLHFRKGNVEFLTQQRVRSAGLLINPNGVAHMTQIAVQGA